MEIVLLERVANLGQVGDIVKVKPGYARNYLLPQNKALRATKNNLAVFEKQKAEYEAKNKKLLEEAKAEAKKVEGKVVQLIRQAGESGQLYGSASTRDIADSLHEEGFHVSRNQVQLNHVIKMLGVYKVPVMLHPEVIVEIEVNVAKSKEEANAQYQAYLRGETLVGDKAEQENVEAQEETEESKLEASADETQEVEANSSEEVDAPKEEAETKE